jgi:hypothetical protein
MSNPWTWTRTAAPATADFTLGPPRSLIDHGVYIPGINGGFKGQAPTIGAVESQ